MINPSLDALMTKVDSKYTLVVISSKIARKLTDEQTDNTNPKVNPVTVALHRIADGQVGWERTKVGIK